MLAVLSCSKEPIPQQHPPELVALDGLRASTRQVYVDLLEQIRAHNAGIVDAMAKQFAKMLHFREAGIAIGGWVGTLDEVGAQRVE